MSEVEIPTRVEELTPEWLTRALGSTGMLRDARVTGVKREILGEGEGFMGQVVRLHLELDRPEAGVPSSLVAKLPTQSENRIVGELMGAYEREILFYRLLGPDLPVRAPRAYYADMDGSATSEKEAQGAAMMDRMPMWLIRYGMMLVRWIVSRRSRRYVLLIEDMGNARIGDQVAGCSPEEAERVLRAVARIHAMHWQSPELDSHYWLRRQDLNPRTLHSVFLDNVPGLEARFRGGAPASFHDSILWLKSHAPDLYGAFYSAAPETLLHCDLRLDNVCFLPSANEPGGPSETVGGGGAGQSVSQEQAGLFDWQLVGRGPGAYDVGYFIASALAVDVPEEVERDLLRSYHEVLLANGVADYSFDDCLRDYHRALLIVLHRIASTDSMELGNDRGSAVIAEWLGRTMARIEGLELDSLLR